MSTFFISISATATEYVARFELNNYKEGIRLAEFRTALYDVAYKAIEAHEDSVVFKVYFTNISKKTITVDSSLFSITSVETHEKATGEDPEQLGPEIDKSMYFTKSVLPPNESAGGRVVFSVKNAPGRWVFKNKLTPDAFNFDVREVSEQ
ncbi:MAG: hypothetical protein ACXWQQ_08390 [Pseudobdellovibrio sp.]